MIHRPRKKNAFLSFALVWWLAHLPLLDARVSAITVMVPLITSEECEARRAASSGNRGEEGGGTCCMNRASHRRSGSAGSALAGRTASPPPMRCFLCVRMNDLNVFPGIGGRPLPALQLAGIVSDNRFAPVDQRVRPPVPPPQTPFLS